MFFVEKISALRPSSPQAETDPCAPPPSRAVFEQFESVRLSLLKVAHHMRPVNSPTDCVPSHHFKEAFDLVGPTILALINSSAFKNAVVHPLIKKKNQGPRFLKKLFLSNFRHF